MASKRRRFDPEFRAGAVRIVKETGKPVAQVARDLGINPYTLNNWMHMDRLAAQHGSGDQTTAPAESEQEELARLRREKTELTRELAQEKAAWEKERAELEDERDVLKRSVVLWVKEAMGR
ncbi:transposase [Streptosporangium lutulentum]|uniref:Transposase n=1 Tax=Streptosporangium lutulentum TaxID=1461250 RepID=A0ABT9QL52_9ACTN|nr:transposase [Streptosporangium lutulentum]MDP9846993.1 transposase [Streptosporangium lutulentum]